MAVVIGYACTSLLIFFSQLVFFRRIMSGHKLLFSKGQKWLRQMLVYSLPFATWGIIGSVQQSSARWALEMFTSTENVGLYSIVSQLGYAPLRMMTSTAMVFIMPILFTRTGDATSEVRNKNVGELIKKIGCY